MILVDTSVWTQSKRRDGNRERQVIDALIERDQIATTGLVVAEILQGASSEELYAEWYDTLGGPHYFPDSREIWENAARLSFDLRRRGQETALSDLVIAMVAIENDLEVYANDSDFDRVPGLRRYNPA